MLKAKADPPRRTTDYSLKLDIPLYAPNPNTVDVVLPANLTTRTSYILVLLGSTNNASPEFTIISNPLGAVSGKQRLS